MSFGNAGLYYGGPDRSIKVDSFQSGIILPRRYRNRRLGDFLKELDLTEGKATGIPTIRKSMKDNGSSEPQFETDDDRSFFQVTIPIHSDFIEPGGTLPQNEGTIEGTIEGISKRVLMRLTNLLTAIIDKEGERVPYYAQITGIPNSKIERYIKQLRNAGLIDFSDGANQIGGYRITDKLKKELLK